LGEIDKGSGERSRWIMGGSEPDTPSKGTKTPPPPPADPQVSDPVLFAGQ